ncbi:MAG TPA: type II secretion system F family protein [Chloroflexi bacterium]|nr:type II secretion system F family protein [Chloroflexota bacterium]
MEGINLLQFLPFVLGGIALLIAIALIAIGVSNANQKDPLAERLAEYGSQQEVVANLEEIEMSIPFTQRVLIPLLQQIAKFTTQFAPQQALERTQRMLDLAGNPSGLTPSVFWAMRLLGMLGLSVMMILLFSRKSAIYLIAGGVGGAVLGFMMPQMWLSSKITRRQQAIIKALPDALDLMSIAVEAGLGFDQAMAQVYEKWDNELALAFGRVIREIQLGKTRREALRSMAESMDVPDVTSFTAAIIQADQLGVSISRVLKIQADQMRVKRRQRAQEKAQQAPIKMMIPLVILIFPSIWLVILGPAAVQLYKSFFGGG